MNRQLNQRLVEIRTYLEAQPLTEAQDWNKAKTLLKDLNQQIGQAIKSDSPKSAATSLHNAVGLMAAALLWATGERKPSTLIRKAMGSLDKLLPATVEDK